MKNIIIVESPTKSKTIETYMGDDFKVLSSKGHICDLATSGKDGLGIDIENDFKPTYIINKDKTKLVNDLKKECKDAKVYLATDPDREGEAISYHLANVLGLDFNELNRVEFHEITQPAVKEAFLHPRKIDLNLTSSQETRRILDRIIGFKVSKLLQSRIKSKSAGRVQSVALKMICDLEKEILAFVPTKYYEAEAIFKDFKLELVKYKNSTKKILERKILEDLVPKLTDFVVAEVAEKENKRESKPPFTTSTLQQDASNKLGFSSTKTMMIAQSLYEGKEINGIHVGLITYMRTDSTHISDIFKKEARAYILNNYGNSYLGHAKERTQKLAQNAHEAIRPTSVYRNPEEIKRFLSVDEYKLYKLIYDRALSSLMAPALFLNKKVNFTACDTLWSCSGQTLIFDGYLALAGKSSDALDKLLPDFKVGDSYKPLEINIKDLETKPHARYTEATLIKDMEEKGIGRPSTYAQTMQTLTKRDYIRIEDKKLIPTEQGILTTAKLDEFFPSIFNVSYTANMEECLDIIARGEKTELSELQEFYQEFLPVFEDAKKNMPKLEPKKTGEFCPECGSPLVLRKGKYGEFVACSNYPDCKYIKKEEKEEPEDTGIICPVCHKGHLVKKIASRGKNKGKTFYACDNFPSCKTAFNDIPTNEICPKCGSMMLRDSDGKLYCSNNCSDNDLYEPILCPKCHTGHIIKRVATKGKNKGNVFYSCDNFPKCKMLFSGKPLKQICDKCGSTMMELDGKIVCSNPKCKDNEEK